MNGSIAYQDDNKAMRDASPSIGKRPLCSLASQRTRPAVSEDLDDKSFSA